MNMNKIIDEDIKIASVLFKKDPAAKQYMLLASELVLMIEVNNGNNPPTADRVTKDALFKTIIDAYKAGFSRGMQYAQNLQKADHEQH